MDIGLIMLFVGLTIVNVVLNTARVIITVKGGKFLSALTSAIAFGFYALMTIYIVVMPIGNWWKVAITAVVNFVGVYFVKYLEAKIRKDRLWLVDVVIYPKNLELMHTLLNKAGIQFIETPMSNSDSHLFHIYSNTQDESREIKNMLGEIGAKYVVMESKSL